MLVIFLILDFFLIFFRKAGPQRGLQYHVCLIFVYFGWKKNSKKKYFSIIFLSFNMKYYWKFFFFGIFFLTEIYKDQTYVIFGDLKGTCFLGKEKKKSNIKKITSIFPVTQVKSINRELILQIFFGVYSRDLGGKWYAAPRL